MDPDAVFEIIPSPMDDVEARKSQGDTGLSFQDDMGEDSIRYYTPAAADGHYYVPYKSMQSGGVTQICIFDEKGESVSTLQLTAGEDEELYCISAAPDGSFFAVINRMEDDPDTGRWDIVSFGKKGKEKWRKTLSSEESFDVRGMASTKDLTALLTEKDVLLLDNAGKSEKRVDLPVRDFYGNICTDGKETLILAGSSGNILNAWTYETAEGTFRKSRLASSGLYVADTCFCGCGGYDFFIQQQDGIYGVRLDGTAPVRVLDYIGSDLNISYLEGFAVLSARSILLISEGLKEGTSVVLLKRADPEEVLSKINLTLGCTEADSFLRKAVVDFNKSNRKIHVNLVEYPYDDLGISRFSSEIAQGNIPDMICVSPDMPLEGFADKGIFEEIEPMFRDDPELGGADYLENVLDACRIDGKMYFVMPSFSVTGLIGKKKDFGSTRGVTVSQLEKMIRKKEMSYDKALGIITRDEILGWILYYALDNFVDWDRGTCSFQSEEFIDLLEFSKKFPKSIKYEKIDWDENDAAVRSGKQLVRDINFYNMESYMAERYGYFGEEIVYMGYPGDGKNGPSIRDSIRIAMSSTGGNKNACWEFLRTFYLDEYQNSVEISFPVRRDALLAVLDQSMHPQTYTYTDEHGKEVTEVIGLTQMYLNGKTIKIPVPVQKDVDTVFSMLGSLDTLAAEDTNISNIIREEAGAFFSGQKSARETAQIIQSRVKVYIIETK